MEEVVLALAPGDGSACLRHHSGRNNAKSRRDESSSGGIHSRASASRTRTCNRSNTIANPLESSGDIRIARRRAETKMAVPTTTEAVSSLAKRPWRRFSLRALFAAFLVISIVLGWVAYRARFLQSQYAWIKEFQSLHRNAISLKPVSNEWFWRPLVGDAAVTVKRAFLNGYSYEQRKHVLTEEVLEQVKGWTEVEQLVLAGPVITDETVRFVGGFRQLTLFALEDTRVTDMGTAHFARLPSLREFAIVAHRDRRVVPVDTITEASLKNLVVGKDLSVLGLGVPITDEGLSFIVENCPNLAHLELTGSRITGKGLANLRRLKKLNRLVVFDNHSLDDAAILELSHLQGLSSVWLRGTSVSPRGVAALKADLPRVAVQFEHR